MDDEHIDRDEDDIAFPAAATIQSTIIWMYVASASPAERSTIRPSSVNRISRNSQIRMPEPRLHHAVVSC